MIADEHIELKAGTYQADVVRGGNLMPGQVMLDQPIGQYVLHQGNENAGSLPSEVLDELQRQELAVVVD